MLAGSPTGLAEASSFCYGLVIQLQLLSTLPHGNAVTLVVQAGNVRLEGTFTLLIKRLHRRTSRNREISVVCHAISEVSRLRLQVGDRPLRRVHSGVYRRWGQATPDAQPCSPAKRRTLLQVQRSGVSGSPREVGSTNRSSASHNAGCECVKGFRLPPGRRTRPCGVASCSRNSRKPA